MRSLRSLAAALALLSSLVPAAASAQEEAVVVIDPPRLRFGVDMGAGMSWDAVGNPGGAVQTGVRAGVQIDRSFGVYYFGRVALAGIETDARRTVWLSTTSNGVGFDVTLLSVVQLGAGLSLDYLAGDACGRTLCFRAEEGWYAGIDVRFAFVAFALENLQTGQRSGLLVSATWHTTPLPDQVTGVGALHSLVLGAGWEMF